MMFQANVIPEDCLVHCAEEKVKNPDIDAVSITSYLCFCVESYRDSTEANDDYKSCKLSFDYSGKMFIL